MARTENPKSQHTRTRRLKIIGTSDRPSHQTPGTHAPWCSGFLFRKLVHAVDDVYLPSRAIDRGRARVRASRRPC